MEADRTVAILGAGAVGGYLGARLAASPFAPQVILIGRPLLVDAIECNGLVLHEAGGNRTERLAAVSSAEHVAPADLTVLTVRTYDVSSAVLQARRLMGEKGLLLAMQNGVGTEDELAEALGRDRVLAGTLTASVTMDQPGVITRLSSSGGVALSTLNNLPVPHWVVDLFRATGLQVSTTDDYRSLRWSKLLLNMLGAATTSILNVDMASLVANPSLFRLEQRAFLEAGMVMDAQGIRTVDLPGYPVRLARLVMRLPSPVAQRLIGPRMAAARSGRAPSARRDMERGRSEIGTLNGAVVKAGRRLNIPVPMNEALLELVENLAAHPEKRVDLSSNPGRLLSLLQDRGVQI